MSSDLISKLAKVKNKISELTKIESRLKEDLHKLFDKYGVDEMSNSEYMCTRKVYNTKVLKKENVPEEIFERYSIPRTWSAIYVRHITLE